VAGIVSDLASSETAFVTGTSLKIDGGFTATKKVFSQLE
jgi:NAD(P)-dependent dehydrogenase (short-subunit alcohol dehydrogenase family)